MSNLDYPVFHRTAAAARGRRVLATAPDFPGCSPHRETPEKALANVRLAIAEWIEEAGEIGHPIPPPSRRMAAAE